MNRVNETVRGYAYYLQYLRSFPVQNRPCRRHVSLRIWLKKVFLRWQHLFFESRYHISQNDGHLILERALKLQSCLRSPFVLSLAVLKCSEGDRNHILTSTLVSLTTQQSPPHSLVLLCDSSCSSWLLVFSAVPLFTLLNWYFTTLCLYPLRGKTKSNLFLISGNLHKTATGNLLLERF